MSKKKNVTLADLLCSDLTRDFYRGRTRYSSGVQTSRRRCIMIKFHPLTTERRHFHMIFFFLSCGQTHLQKNVLGSPRCFHKSTLIGYHLTPKLSVTYQKLWLKTKQAASRPHPSTVTTVSGQCWGWAPAWFRVPFGLNLTRFPSVIC